MIGFEDAPAGIEAIRADLKGPAAGSSARFADLASRHSECPTALEGGRLGEVVPGQLFPSLDAALFALALARPTAAAGDSFSASVSWRSCLLSLSA